MNGDGLSAVEKYGSPDTVERAKEAYARLVQCAGYDPLE